MFKCKVCTEKDLRIADLKEHIRALSPHNKASEIPLLHIEADKIMSGSDEVMEVTSEEVRGMSEEDLRILSERDRLLSGNYE